MKISEKDTFIHRSPHRLLRSFTFPNPTALAYDRAKIIIILTLTPLRIIIPFPLSLNSSTNSEVQNSSPRWIFGGDTIIFASRKETNGKPPLPQIEAALNRQSCSSGFATGGVLSVLEDDQKWYPCAFISKSLNEIERNYEIYDREMLSIMRCLEDWRHYLEGAKERFEILSDHKNLQYFLTSKKLNRRQARWC